MTWHKTELQVGCNTNLCTTCTQSSEEFRIDTVMVCDLNLYPLNGCELTSNEIRYHNIHKESISPHK